ncbi:Aminoacyl carrier protein [Cupriavidus yeoncheonensis]|uniref:Aminoacyl carrier protein n=1 Tax=Cupriavidus yeoncheonensis TaxID=1462994 RepID=A0A916J307_9BURK|nr:acyl carrier protein [Cupriavidus yeoncheonensis]CAG2156955.1 Aminoacyl carrier protein [Cupriavidus yeoncheonensis]
MKTTIREILSEVARLDVSVDSLDDDADLYEAGLTSVATVHMMLAIENALGVEMPDNMIQRELFRSINSLAAAAETLRQPREAA